MAPYLMICKLISRPSGIWEEGIRMRNYYTLLNCTGSSFVSILGTEYAAFGKPATCKAVVYIFITFDVFRSTLQKQESLNFRKRSPKIKAWWT
jgi:hypothetical protein